MKETMNAVDNTAKGTGDAFKNAAVKTGCEFHRLPDEAYRLAGEGLAVMGTMLDTAMQQLSDAVDVAGTIYDLMNTCSEAAEKDRHQSGRAERGMNAGDENKGSAVGENNNKTDRKAETSKISEKKAANEHKDGYEPDDIDLLFDHLFKVMNGPFSAMEMVVDTDLDASIMDELSMLQICEWFGLDDEVAEIPDLDDMFFAYAQDDSAVRKDGSILITGPVVVFRLDEDGETVIPSLEELTRAFMYLGSIAVTERTRDGKKFRAFLLK